jgi:hypothetical protein
MSNRYGSYSRTIVARNVVWDGSVAPFAGKVLASPSPLVINNPGDTQGQFFQFNNGSLSGDEWNTDGNAFIKRIGVFSNYADGLIFATPSSRLSVQVRTAVVEIIPQQQAGLMNFTAGSNVVTGTGFNQLSSSPCFIADTANVYDAHYYTFYRQNNVLGYISDYAFVDKVAAPVSEVALQNTLSSVTLRSIGQLNQFYDAEFFLPAHITKLTAAQTVLFYGVLNLDSGLSMNFATNIIDVTLNNNIVTFDIMAEVEVTPAPVP